MSVSPDNSLLFASLALTADDAGGGKQQGCTDNKQPHATDHGGANQPMLLRSVLDQHRPRHRIVVAHPDRGLVDGKLAILRDLLPEGLAHPGRPEVMDAALPVLPRQ